MQMIMKDVKTMTDKAYIVANEQQEMAVLEKLEHWGTEWRRSKKNPTDFIPSHDAYNIQFPYCLVLDYDQLGWCNMELLPNYKIVYDGRKEEQMSDKYVVSLEFMNELKEWKESNITDTLNEKYYYTSIGDLDQLPGMIKEWWLEDFVDTLQTNNRLIAIIRWANGEDVFEVEKPKKWVVRSKATDNDGDYRYVSLFDSCFGITYADSGKDKSEYAAHFDTKEEAESWANSHQEVIKVEVEA